MARRSTTSAPAIGMAPPSTPEPPPYGTIGVRCARARRTTAATSAVVRGRNLNEKLNIAAIGAGGVVCLTGVGTGGRTATMPVADIAAQVVLGNQVLVGSVNANKRHWYKAGQVLARADRDWLARLVSRREPPAEFARALRRTPDDIKVVVQFSGA